VAAQLHLRAAPYTPLALGFYVPALIVATTISAAAQPNAQTGALYAVTLTPTTLITGALDLVVAMQCTAGTVQPKQVTLVVDSFQPVSFNWSAQHASKQHAHQHSASK
jgi:hypothetical protein